MEIEIAFTARQLDLLRHARDRDAPNETIEEYIVRAFVSDSEREAIDLAAGDEHD